MKEIIKQIALLVYYLLARWFPTQPIPGWRVGYAVRRTLLRHIADSSGENVIVKSNAYIGNGEGLHVGSNSQLGHNCRIGKFVTLGENVIMGPDVVIMTASHEFELLDVPVRLQGEKPIRPISIGDDVWIGTRVCILPGVTVGDHAIIGAGSIVTSDVPKAAIVAGCPARVLRYRGISNVEKSNL